MDILTMLTVRDMYKDKDVDFDKWLDVTIEQLEENIDARYQEHLTTNQEKNHE